MDHGRRPVIGITANFEKGAYLLNDAYVERVRKAGGTPILLPHCLECLDQHLAMCDGIIVTGGDDPNMEAFGIPTHAASTRVDRRRQDYEVALLQRVSPLQPVLGICLGMQWMSIIAGGEFNQNLPDVLPNAEEHRHDRVHRVEGEIGEGTVTSAHRQGVMHAGSLKVIGRAHDGVIEAVQDVRRPFYIGVQWHPERTADPLFGDGIFERLIAACRNAE